MKVDLTNDGSINHAFFIKGSGISDMQRNRPRKLNYDNLLIMSVHVQLNLVV